MRPHLFLTTEVAENAEENISKTARIRVQQQQRNPAGLVSFPAAEPYRFLSLPLRPLRPLRSHIKNRIKKQYQVLFFMLFFMRPRLRSAAPVGAAKPSVQREAAVAG